MAITQIQDGNTAGVVQSGNPGTIFSSNVSASDAVVVGINVIGGGGGSVSAVSGLGMPSWHKAGALFSSSLYNGTTEIWVGFNSAGGSRSLTVTTTSAGSWLANATEFSNAASVVGSFSSGQSTNGTAASISIVPAIGDAVFAVVLASNSNFISSPPGSPWTDQENDTEIGSAWQIATGSVAVTATWTQSPAGSWITEATLLTPASTNSSASAGVASVAVTAYQPTGNAFAGVANVIATAWQPNTPATAGLASVAATAYNPTATNASLAGLASVAAIAYNPSASVNAYPTAASVQIDAYPVAIPPFSQMPIVQLQVAFNNNSFDPISSMVWTDITQYIDTTANIQYGRAHALDGVAAATLTVTLNDRDGRFTPYNTTSPYYGNGQTTGLVPSKPVRMIASEGSTAYPIFYGYVSGWSPIVIDQVNQDCQLTATDLLGMLGKMYLANPSLYPNLVESSSPITYYRLADFTTQFDGTAMSALASYTGSSVTSGSVVVPSPSMVPQTPYWLGGQTGDILYDPSTQIALGDSGTAQTAISTAQSNITNAQNQLTNDQATVATDTTTVNTDIGLCTTDAAAAYSAAYGMDFACQVTSGAAYNAEFVAAVTYNQARAGGHANTINSAAVTYATSTYAYGYAQQAVSAALAAVGACAACESAVSSGAQALVNATNNAMTAQTAAAAAIQTYSDWANSLVSAMQATGAQAQADGDTATANDAYNSSATLQTAATYAYNTISTGYTLQSALQTLQSDSNSYLSDYTTLVSDEALVANDIAQLAVANAGALVAVANTAAYIIIKGTTPSGAYGGSGWFTTTTLPTAGYLGQTIATVSYPSGGPVGSISINANGFLQFTVGGVAHITSSASFTNAAGNTTTTVSNGILHQVAWTLNAVGGTFSLYLDGILQGSYTSSSLYPGVQVSGFEVLVGAGVVSGVTQGDFIGSVQDWALFNSSSFNATAIAAQYVLGSKFQHIHTTTDRTQDVLLVALGQTGYNNIPQNLLGQLTVFPEPNQLIQTSGLAYLGQVAASENGFLFQAPDGTITLLPINYAQLYEQTSNGVFADNPTTSFHYEAQSFQFPLNDDDLYSTIQIMQSTGANPTTDTGAPAQIANLGQFIEVVNQTSLAAFGSRTYQQSGILLNSQSDITFLANLLLARYAFPLPHVGGLLLSSANVPNLPQMLGRQLWDRVTVERQGPGETSFTQDSVIEQINHVINVQIPEWQTTWSLSPWELIYAGDGYGGLAQITATAYGPSTSASVNAGVAGVTAAAFNPGSSNGLMGDLFIGNALLGA